MTASAPHTVDQDALAPRDGRERYRIYKLLRLDVEMIEGYGGRARSVPTVHDELRLLATAPDAAGVGHALLWLREEGEYGGDDRLGVLDTCPDGEPSETGVWILNPWAVGR